jgi:hypothetical protein
LTKASQTTSFLLITLMFSLATIANAQTATSPLEKLPYSGGVLMSRAIRAGRVHLGGNAFVAPELPPSETCTPAPCVLPNIDIFASSNPVNETPVVVNPKNPKQLMAGANDYNCPNTQGFYNSNDGGTTWSHFCMQNLSGAFGEGDPGVGYDLKGNAYITGIDSTPAIIFQKSKNNGGTWSAPAIAVTSTLGGLTDKSWLQIDTSPTSRWPNWLYISVTQFASNNNSQISVSHSTNGGTSWTTAAVDSVQVFPNVDQFSDLAITRDGTVYVTWQRCTANGATGDCGGTTATMVISKSNDGGNTWSKPATIAKAALAPDPNSCCFYGALPVTANERVSNIPVIGVDNSTGAHKGNLYVAYYKWTGTQMKMMVATSKNGGKTWTSKPVAPPSAKGDQFFPWLNVSSKGVVGVSWDDRRHDATDTNYESFAAFSTNGGTSFTKNVKLSAKPSNPNNDGFSGGFLGDYTGNYWSGPNTLYVTYTDTSTGVDQDFLGGYIR